VGVTEIHPPTAVRVAASSVGRGVFAVREIGAGERIELCPVLALNEEESYGTLANYCVDAGDDAEGKRLMLGYGSLYNHSDDPNAEYVHEADDAYAFVAIRDIAAGEQITINYGQEWWETRGLDPSEE
jgi:SET domain-containing protein